MIQATQKHISILKELLYKMYHEVSPLLASTDKALYERQARKHLKKDTVWLDDSLMGFFIMRDESIPVLNQTLWNGVSVYIEPQYRNSKMLKNFYEFMFENYKGTIMGFTDVKSEHNKVLSKRHNLLGYVYELKREIT